VTARKTLDIDADLDALLAQREKKRKNHLLMLGEIVVASGIHKLVDGDELKTILTRERDRLSTKPDPREDAQAEDRPQEDRPGNAGGTFPAKPAASPQAHHAQPQPSRPRTPDLLAGTATE
jgi:hypothetical protein